MSEIDQDQRITVINILAVSFTGSTWLNLMLGTHPDVASVGEFDRLLKMGRPICSIHGDDCPLWSRFDPNSDENPFLQAARLTGKRILVVNNVRRLRKQLEDPRIDRRYILLFRDGRAFAASYLKKQPAGTIVRATWKWFREWERRLTWTVKDRRSKTQMLHFERIVADPAETLREVCRFLEIDDRHDLTNYAQAEPHFIGGNVGPISVVARAHGLPTLTLQLHDKRLQVIDIEQDEHEIEEFGRKRKLDLAPYRKSQGQVIRKERWPDQLTTRQIRSFALLAGWLNRLFGYPPSKDRSSIPKQRPRLNYLLSRFQGGRS
ncbi:MAG: sulfotransferase domain-containing protein [Planctomycetota bacterium]